MRRKIRKFLALDPNDQTPLRLLSPVFGLSAAITIVIASVSKSLFLSANSIDKLPWMFLGAALFTVLISLIYTEVMERVPLEQRFKILLFLTAASFAGLRLWYPSDPKIVSMAILLWCPGMAYLVAVQAWSLSSDLLPTRKAKRMVPVLAAIATTGAILGGLLVQLLTGMLGAENLLWVAVILLLVLFLSLGRVCSTILSDSEAAARKEEGGPDFFSDQEPSDERVFKKLWKRPLVRSLAAFVFFAQAASILVDFQFSAELQKNYGRDAMAGFLGAFYWISNLLVLLLSLLVSRKLIRSAGIGFVLCGGAIALVVGSVVYLSVGMLHGGNTFWIIACAAFAERLGHFAFTRSASQMLVMPMNTRTAQQAKLLVEGVVYKLASVLGAVILLVWAPVSLYSLSPIVILFGALACEAGFRTEPHYKAELNEGMVSGRVQGALLTFLGLGVGRQSRVQIESRLRGTDRGEILGTLAVVQDLKIPVGRQLLEQNAYSADPEVATAALETLDKLNMRPSDKLFRDLLNPQKDLSIIRHAFRLLGNEGDESLADTVQALCEHEDDTVAAMAGVYLMRHEGGYATAEIEAEIDKDLADLYLDVHARPPRTVVGQDRTLEIARDLPERVKDPSPDVCRAAVETMGQLALPRFVPLLVESFERLELRDAARDALFAHGPQVVGQLSEIFHVGGMTQVGQTELIRVLERFADRHSVHLIGRFAERDDLAVRSHAVAALWRLARSRTAVRLTEERIDALIDRDVGLLKRFSAIEALVPERAQPREDFFLREVEHMRVNTEERVFRLLGLLYDRDAIYRAHLNYRSDDVRMRSNAIELLDVHIREEKHRIFVPLVEKSEHEGGTFRPRTSVYMPVLEIIDADDLLGQKETWFLDRVWKWARSEPEANADADEWGDPLNRVWQLTRMDLFRGLHGAELLPLSLKLEPKTYAPGSLVIRQGGSGSCVHLILSGRANVERDGGVLTELNAYDSLGLASLSANCSYMADVRATTLLTVLEVERVDIRNLLSLYPEANRGIIQILAGRLRVRIERQRSEPSHGM